MNDTEEYDGRLRSVFESCDRNGSGYLSLEEFEDLCSELCLEDERLLLQKVLFKETSCKLAYERFKEVLLLLIEGTLTEKHTEMGFDPSVNNSLIQFDNDSLDGDSSTKNYQGSNKINLDNELNRKRRDSLGSPEVYPSERPVNAIVSLPNALLMDFDPLFDHSSPQKKYSRTSTVQLSSTMLSPIKRYGRSSSPDEDLLQDHAMFQQQPLNEAMHPNHNENLHPTLSRVVIEEFTGKGDGGDWINPDHDVSNGGYGDDIGVTATSQTTNEAQEALASIWIQMVGGFDEKINIFQFQQLFLTQAPNTSISDVEKLFEMLDEDADGFIAFDHFSEQMSAFMMSSDESQARESKDECTLSSKNLVLSNNASSPLPYPTSSVSSSQTSPETFVSTLHHYHTANDNKQITSLEIDQSQLKKNRVTTKKTETQGQWSSTSMESNKHEIPSTDKTDNEAEDTMQLYHGVPPYRRRRRSTQTSSRQRRRSSRVTSLPYYHPISRRKVEECPLFFLAEENESYVRSEKIRNVFSDEGIEDADKIFQDLGLGLDDSFSVEILSEVFELELKDYPVHFALCALYKHGMNYYKSQCDYEASEKNKLESLMKHLDSQIEEQEERIEKLESDYRERVEVMENRYKSKLTRWKMKLGTEQDKQEQLKGEETKQMKTQIERLKLSEKKLLEDLKEKEAEEQELLQRYSDLENQLKTAESNLILMRNDFDQLISQTSLYNQTHLEERHTIEKMMQDYAAESQRLQDQNDKLFRQMDFISKRWSRYEQAELPPTNAGLENDSSISLQQNPPKETSDSKVSVFRIPEESSSSNSQRFVNKISIIPSSTKTSSGSLHLSGNEGSISTPKKSHVSTYFIKSQSVASGKIRKSTNTANPSANIGATI